MEKLKVHIQLIMLWVFKNNKNATETINIYNIYSQGGASVTVKSETGF